MTDQETFDFVVRALRKQGGPSLMPDLKGCAYRGKDGRKCAVGQILPDEDYVEDLEGLPVRSLESDRNPITQWVLEQGLNVRLLSDLQCAHDSPQDLELDTGVSDDVWLDAFLLSARQIAERYNLDLACTTEPL